MEETPLRIMGLSGSYGKSSKNGMLVDLALKKAAELGADVVYWDLTEEPLPLVGAEGCWSDPITKKFQEEASNCDGFLVSSPEYHGTMSGVMKNTFDDPLVTSRSYFTESSYGEIGEFMGQQTPSTVYWIGGKNLSRS